MEGTGYACPTCERGLGDIVEVMAAPGRKLVCSKLPQVHFWVDLEEFIALQPKMAFQKQQAAAPQENHVNVQVKVPRTTHERLKAKYGDRLDATMTAALNVLEEGETMSISGTDLERLQTVLPERIKNGGHLFGMVFALSQQVIEAKQEASNVAAEVKAYEGMGGTKVLLDLDTFYNTAAQRAQAEGLPMKLWLAERVRTALENNWF